MYVCSSCCPRVVRLAHVGFPPSAARAETQLGSIVPPIAPSDHPFSFTPPPGEPPINPFRPPTQRAVPVDVLVSRSRSILNTLPQHREPNSLQPMNQSAASYMRTYASRNRTPAVEVPVLVAGQAASSTARAPTARSSRVPPVIFPQVEAEGLSLKINVVIFPLPVSKVLLCSPHIS